MFVETYDRNIPLSKYYTSQRTGQEGYNPKKTYYYNSSDELLKVREEWRGVIYEQTISGSSYANHTVNYTVTYNEWATVSG